MRTPTRQLTLDQEVAASQQVVGVLGRIDSRYEAGQWESGRRFSSDGGSCLVGAIDEATRWTIPGVADQVARQLVVSLPPQRRLLRAVGRFLPRVALMVFNDTLGREKGAIKLVQDTRDRLGATYQPPAADNTTPEPMVVPAG